MGAEQFGFMPIRGTANATFATRQLREIQKEPNTLFVDLEKAYDRVSRQDV